MKNQRPPAKIRKEKTKSPLYSFQESDLEDYGEGAWYASQDDAALLEEEENIEEEDESATTDEEAASLGEGKGKSENVTVIFYTPDAEMMESEPFLDEMSYATRLQREISNKMNIINSTYLTKTLVCHEYDRSLSLSDRLYDRHGDVCPGKDDNDDADDGEFEPEGKEKRGCVAIGANLALNAISCGLYPEGGENATTAGDKEKEIASRERGRGGSGGGSGGSRSGNRTLALDLDSDTIYQGTVGNFESVPRGRGWATAPSLTLLLADDEDENDGGDDRRYDGEDYDARLSKRRTRETKVDSLKGEKKARALAAPTVVNVGSAVIRWSVGDLSHYRPYYSHVEMVLGKYTYSIRWGECITKYKRKKYISKNMVYTCVRLNLNPFAYRKLEAFCDAAWNDSRGFNYLGLYFNFLSPGFLRRRVCENGNSYWDETRVFCSEFLARAFCHVGIFSDKCGLWKEDDAMAARRRSYEKKKTKPRTADKRGGDEEDDGGEESFYFDPTLNEHLDSKGNVLADPATTSPNVLYLLLNLKKYMCRWKRGNRHPFAGEGHRHVMECSIPTYDATLSQGGGGKMQPARSFDSTMTTTTTTTTTTKQ
jgi:hypothetical protein